MAPLHSSGDKATRADHLVPGRRPRERCGDGPPPDLARRTDKSTPNHDHGVTLTGLTIEQAYDACDIPSYCGRGVLVGTATDGSRIKLVPIFCKRWACPHCGPLKQQRWMRILLAGKPERHITLTCKPHARATPAEAAVAIKRAWSRFVDHFRRSGHQCQYAWTLQYHRNGWPHLHILQRGDYIPHHDLSCWMSRHLDSPIVYLRRIQDARAAVRDIIRYVQAPLTKSGDQVSAGARIYRSRGYSPTDDPSPSVDDPVQYEWEYRRDTTASLLLRYLVLYGGEAVTHYPDGSIVIKLVGNGRNSIASMDSLAPKPDT